MGKVKVSIVTPWLDCPELISSFERSYTGVPIMSVYSETEVVIIDNGSQPENAAQLQAMVKRMKGIYLRNDHNAKYAAANNQGLAVATGNVIVFVNNDTDYTGNSTFADIVAEDIQGGALYGPSLLTRTIAGKQCPYIEGYCIAATRDTWQRLNGWDAEHFSGMYWEDNDVCYRALGLGIELIQTSWPVWHYGNYTSGRTPGAYDNSVTNQQAFIERVTNDR